MVSHSSTLAWKIPWTEEPGSLQSMGSLRVGHDWATSLFTFHFHALEKEMAAHSSVLAWRILGTAEPGGLPSMGSHRVGHDWSNAAAAAAAPAPKCFGTCSSGYVWDRNSNLWWLSNYLIGLMWVLNIRHDTIESLAQCLMGIKDWHTSDILWVGFQTTRINRVTQIFLVSQYYMLCLHFTVFP